MSAVPLQITRSLHPARPPGRAPVKTCTTAGDIVGDRRTDRPASAFRAVSVVDIKVRASISIQPVPSRVARPVPSGYTARDEQCHGGAAARSRSLVFRDYRRGLHHCRPAPPPNHLTRLRLAIYGSGTVCRPPRKIDGSRHGGHHRPPAPDPRHPLLADPPPSVRRSTPILLSLDRYRCGRVCPKRPRSYGGPATACSAIRPARSNLGEEQILRTWQPYPPSAISQNWRALMGLRSD